MRGRDSGVVLLLSLVFMFAILGVAGSVFYLAIAEAKAARESSEQVISLYLAESGLEAAVHEIVKSEDPDSNGIGNKNVTNSAGNYTVTVQDLGGFVYQLTSTGDSGGATVTVDQVIKLRYTTAFPTAAVSVVGNINEFELDIEEDLDLFIDGGDSPAMSFSDVDLYNKLGLDMANAMAAGNIPSTNITGTPTNQFTAADLSTWDIPFAHEPAYSSSLTDLSSLYTELVTQVTALKPTATVVTGALAPTYGSPGSPVVIYAPDPRIGSSETVTGYGTLILGKSFEMNNSSLNWTGDIFVVGDGGGDAKLIIEGGTLDVTGNLLIIGEGNLEKTELKVTGGGSVTINGSMFMGADWNVQEGVEAELVVAGNSSFTLNGILNLMSAEAELEFEPNPLNRVFINGMLQIAVPPGVTESHVEFEMKGNVEIYKDDAAIQIGLDALNQLDVNYTIPSISKIMGSGDPEVLSWRRTYN